MKKSILFVAACALGLTTAFAQDLTSKKGEPILPEAGDYAIGVDAYPLLNYFGNMMNGTSNVAPFGWNYTNSGNMITGKMFVSETMAYRGMIRIGFGSNSWTNPVVDDASTSTPVGMTEDELKQSWNYIGLGGGLEWRRGKGRLQGYWGGMLMFSMSGGKSTYSYGNAFSTTNTAPTTTIDFTTGATANTGSRVTENKMGSTMMFGLRGFAGAEFFVLPKISVGGEFGWGLGFSKTGAGTMTSESWNGTGTTSSTSDTGTSSSFGIDTDNNAFGVAPAAVLIHFHF
jgi:hypothetical protein